MAERALSEPTIIREADDWLALNKPAGWHSVSPGKRRADEIKKRGGRIEPSVEDWLREKFAWARDLDDGGLAHRLDFETSGCLVVATSAAAMARLGDAFRREAGIEKVYLAEVPAGIATTGSFRLFFSSRYKRSKKVTVEGQGEAPHEGRCAWRVESSTGDTARVEVQLIGPGRRHQIRAGLAYLGFPILGDVLYEGPASHDGLLHLHASRVVVEGVAAECAPPW